MLKRCDCVGMVWLCYNGVMLKFAGTREDFGRVCAERLQETGHVFDSSVDQETYLRQLEIYERYYPELVAEKRAAAECLGRGGDDLLREDLASFVVAQKRRVNGRPHGCTIFAFEQNGRVYVGRNYDWLPEAREFFEVYDLDLDGAYRYFAVSDEGVWPGHVGREVHKFSPEDVMNEHGLYVGLTYAHVDVWSYGLSSMHLMRYLAEHCTTTAEALEAFRQIPLAVPKNFLIADAKGDLAVVEHRVKNFEVRHVQPGKPLIQTNHFRHNRNVAHDRILAHNANTTSFLRYEEAKYLAQKVLYEHDDTPLSIQDIMNILRHARYIRNDRTIWSLSAELSKKQLWLVAESKSGEKSLKLRFEN